MKDVEQALNYADILTLALAVFMILNTYLINLSERRRQLAIMRAVGATRGQLVRLLALESLLMGLVGGTLGWALGVVGAKFLGAAMASAYSVTTRPMQWSLPALGGGVGLGVIVSLLASVAPAWLTRRISPLEGMQPLIAEPTSRVSARYLVGSLGVILAAVGWVAACLTEVVPIRLAPYAGVALTTALILLLPPLLNPLVNGVSTLLWPILGIEGRIGARQILRHRVRTGLTIGVVYLAVGSVISLGTTVTNGIHDVRVWQEKTVVGDFFLRAAFPDPATGHSVPMPESVGAQVREFPGVVNVDSLRFVETQVDNEPAVLAVHEFSDPQQLHLDQSGANPDSVRRALFAGEVAMGATLANRLHKGRGDVIVLGTPTGPHEVRIATTVNEYLLGGSVVHMERQAAKRLFTVEGADVFMIKVEPQALSTVEQKLGALAQVEGLLLHSFADVRRRLDRLLDGIAASLWGLLSIGFVVAAFGVANTLMMNVMEQTYELALMRVVAMTRQQTRKLIRGQALIMGCGGGLMGLVTGLIGTTITTLASARILGHTVPLAVHPLLLLAALGGTLLIVLAASLLPAVRASRLSLLAALQYE
jgi:putative ABC transport system permease protein